MHGSFVKSLYVTARTGGGGSQRLEKIVLVEYNADTPSRAMLVVSAEGVEGAVGRNAFD